MHPGSILHTPVGTYYKSRSRAVTTGLWEEATKEQISFRELPDYLPGKSWIDSKPLFGDSAIVVRGFDYGRSDVSAPPLDADFIALYTAGATRATRRIDGRVQEAAVGPGFLSFLPRGADCTWSWDQPISVIHVYVPRPVLARTYAAISSDDPDKLVLHDALLVNDPAMFQVGSQMVDECRGAGLGSGLCFETLSQLLAIQLLRKYCHNIGRVTPRGGRLSSRQRTQLTELIEAHLSQPVTLDFLATEIGMSESRLTRLFRTTFGQSIHQYVIERRLLKAKSMLTDPERSIADIAYEAGFSDQSHLTRFFSRAYRTTPAAWRRAALR